MNEGEIFSVLDSHEELLLEIIHTPHWEAIRNAVRDEEARLMHNLLRPAVDVHADLLKKEQYANKLAGIHYVFQEVERQARKYRDTQNGA